MVFKLRSMKFKTKIILLLLVWIASAFFAVFGSIVITTAFISAGTPFTVRESPIVQQIWKDMGELNTYSYFEPVTRISFYGNVSLKYGEPYFIGSDDPFGIGINFIEIPLSDLPNIQMERTNGSIIYDKEIEVISYFFYNGTVFEVKVRQQSFWMDIGRNRFKLHYDASLTNDLTLTKRIFKENEVDETSKYLYFDVTYKSMLQSLRDLIVGVFSDVPKVFGQIGGMFLLMVAIGGGAGMIVAILFSGFRITRLGGKKWTYNILRLLRGRLGRWVSKIPFFDFGGDWYIEQQSVDVIDFTAIRPSLSELFTERWYDILVFPPLLSSILFNIFRVVAKNTDETGIFLYIPLFSPIVLFLLTLYYPLVWTYDEGGVKKMVVGHQGDIVSIKPLGTIIRDGLSVIIGFSGIISIGASAVEVTRDFASSKTITGEFAFGGISFDWFGIVLLVLWTVGLFLILMSSTIVGATIVAINYLQSDHLSNIKNIREKCEEKKLVSNFGSMYYKFNPELGETIISRE